jgi:nitrite reductase/ring-hydroxylating ferredoxin subunit
MTEVDMTSRELSPLEPLVRGIESAEALDPAAIAIGGALQGLLSPGRLKDAVSGTWLGHALHPVLTDLVIGSFTSASAVDLLAGEDGHIASERLIMLGIAAYGPTALSGANDWIDGSFDKRVRRVGIVHAGSNLMALSLYTASLIARRRGAHRRGKLLGGAGASLLMAGGFLGGHLSFRRGIGPDQTVFDPGPEDWMPAADDAQLPEDRPIRVVVDETPVLLLKTGDRIYAIHDRCSHRGCSLSEGTVESNEIVCACHSSRFDLRDGSLLHGPATAPQPAFQVRRRDGRVEVRRLASS